MRYFEDIVPGESHEAGPYRITREDITSFARMYDPQPFHLDDAAAQASVLGGLASSGWHTTSIGMLLYYQGFVQHIAGMGAPGVDEVRWLRPVLVNDVLSMTISVPAARASNSKPDRGFISVVLDLRNQDGQTVMTERFSMMVQRRGTVQTGRPFVAAAQPVPMGEPPVDLALCGFSDEMPVGAETALGAQIFTPEAVIAFAKQFDPQYFHTDPERAKESHFGGLVASGWQTSAMWMKSYIAARDRSAALRREKGLPVAIPGPSPGFTNLKWIRPVYAGETISFYTTLTGTRPLSRPGWCLLETANSGRAADGATVYSFDSRLLWPLAPAGPI